MNIIGAEAVDAAASAGRLEIRPGDKVTPLGRDRAAEIGVEIIEASQLPIRLAARPEASAVGANSIASTGSVPRVDLSGPGALPSPPSPAWFRRGAPYPGLRGRPREAFRASERRGRGTGDSARVARVTVVGAGNVGTHAAMRLAETDLIDEIVLVDIVEGLAQGVALDLTHASGLLGFDARIRGESSIEAAGLSDYTIITAGRPRQPGMSRTDLTATNAEIIGPLASTVGRISPDGVIVVVTNPLDEMTELVWKTSGLPSSRVIGMAGLLDSARFQALAGLAADARPDTIAGLALGSHGDEMVFPVSQARVGTLSAADRLGERLTAVVNRARDSGAEVVSLLGKGSAFITPGLASARMVEYMIRDDGTVLSATVRPAGQYGIDGVYVGLPVRLGRHGLREVVTLPLTDSETTQLRAAASQIRARVADMFVAG